VTNSRPGLCWILPDSPKYWCSCSFSALGVPMLSSALASQVNSGVYARAVKPHINVIIDATLKVLIIFNLMNAKIKT
jgi:hypothetical protein